MAGTISQQVLDEVQKTRKSVEELTTLLIGSPDKPDSPGAMERLRRIEAWKATTSKALYWVASIVLGALILDIISRLLIAYRGG